MGPRGGGPGRGGRGSFGARVGAPPPDLLSIGVVDIPAVRSAQEAIPAPLIESAPPDVVDAETVEVEAAPRAAAKRGTRARPAPGRAARKSGATKTAPAAPAAEAKPRRGRAKKTARTSEE